MRLANGLTVAKLRAVAGHKPFLYSLFICIIYDYVLLSFLTENYISEWPYYYTGI